MIISAFLSSSFTVMGTKLLMCINLKVVAETSSRLTKLIQAILKYLCSLNGKEICAKNAHFISFFYCCFSRYLLILCAPFNQFCNVYPKLSCYILLSLTSGIILLGCKNKLACIVTIYSSLSTGNLQHIKLKIK